MALKKAALAVPWRDERPLIIMAGDSHVEYGDWYGCFGGALAARNCGLAGAKIQDVTALVAAIADRNPEAIVLICGFNSLSRADSVDSCIGLYQQLLLTAQTKLHPKKILALSVMPLRQSVLDRATRTVNGKITLFNQQLAGLCQRNHVVYVDVYPALVDASGGLAPDLTVDGLHLNQEGYRRLASVLQPCISQPPAPLRHDDH